MTKMTGSATTHVEIASLQKEIEGYLGMGEGHLIFEFSEELNRSTVHLITVSPKHRQSFLFHTAVGLNKVDALLHMLSYVKTYKEKSSSYTIQWSLKEEHELHTSYFRASNISSALEKLYFGRDASSIVVFSVVLNPIS